MSERKIKIFNTFEEQEKYHLDWTINSTPKERLLALFQMQAASKAFHKKHSNKRTITIRHGYFE